MSFTLLDGSVGQELVSRSKQAPTPLWSTKVMMETPELVRDVHADYLSVGADIISTNTYPVHRDRLRPADLEEHFESLHLSACRLAKDARDAHGSGQIAGAIGPLGWSYITDGLPPVHEAARAYAEVAALHSDYVDIHLLETLSSLDQLRGALLGMSEATKPVWAAISVDDHDGTRLRSGEPVADVLAAFGQNTPDALLVNCSTPEAVTTALSCLSDSPVPLGAYANGFVEIVPSFAKAGSTVAELSARHDLDPEAYLAHAQTWLSQGATIVGGCCEVGPAHIARLHAARD